MSERTPVSADPMTAGATTPTPWARARAIGLYFCAGEHTRKARNLVLDARCVVVSEATPTAAFGFGIDETFVPTRWRFGEPTT